jgi:hypothetical protein
MSNVFALSSRRLPRSGPKPLQGYFHISANLMHTTAKCIKTHLLAFIYKQPHHKEAMSITTQTPQPSKPLKRKARSNDRASQTARKQATVRRATVSLSADSSEIVERFKAATGMSTSRAIEELIRRSEPRRPRIKMVNGLAVFDFPVKGGKITTEDIRRLEDESW